MAEYSIKKGFDLKLGGKPATNIVDRLDATTAIAETTRIAVTVEKATKDLGVMTLYSQRGA